MNKDLMKKLSFAGFIIDILLVVVFVMAGDPLWVILCGLFGYLNYTNYKDVKDVK